VDIVPVLAPLLDEASDTALFCDYDGTLAPIVEDPDQAVPLPGAAAALAQVARRLGRVAVISGRPVAWLQRQLADAVGVELAGLYGLERLRHGTIVEAAEAGRWRQAIEAVAVAAAAELPGAVRVERKGLAVTLHARTTPEYEDTIVVWADTQAGRTGLAAHRGRRSVELRPPVPVDKGTVVAELGRGYGAVCFIGDDRGDLAAFDALARLAGAGARTVRVAVASDEAPEELLATADLVVDGPSGVLDLLHQLS
jgi:trehalose 6-phosphate phosphatase